MIRGSKKLLSDEWERCMDNDREVEAWILKYVVAVETTLIVSMLTFWFGFYPGLATEHWVREYVIQQPPILKNNPTLIEDVRDNKAILKQLPISLQKINERLLRIEIALKVKKDNGA